MPQNQQSEISVTWSQVAAFRLRRHHLLQRAPVEALVPAAGDVAGVQAQLLPAAQLALWARVRDLSIAQIEDALNERALVKAACMRQTQFLVPSGLLAVFVRGSARRAAKEIRWTLGKGVPERVVDAAIEAALAALDRPLTRAEIAQRVSRALGVQAQAVHGGGWGSRRKVAAVPVGELTFPVVDLLRLVAARHVVCSGPNRGSEPTFVRADAWVPHWQDMPAEQAEDSLLRIYLRAFGPATAADFALWTGMTLREARQIWERQQSRLASVDVEGWAAQVLREDLDELAQAGLPGPPVRLLPYFDTFLLGHKERDHLVAEEHRPAVYRPQGWIAPVVLVDGRILATWEHARAGDRLRLKVAQLEPIAPPTAAGIQKEAQDLARFLGASGVDVQIR